MRNICQSPLLRWRATLIYLAVQIRQARESTRAATVSAFMQSYSLASAAAAQSIEHARILRVGHITPDELGEDEAIVWNFLVSPFVILWETLFRMTCSGAVDPAMWNSIRLDIVLFSKSPGAERFLAINLPSWDSSFPEFAAEIRACQAEPLSHGTQ